MRSELIIYKWLDAKSRLQDCLAAWVLDCAIEQQQKIYEQIKSTLESIE